MDFSDNTENKLQPPPQHTAAIKVSAPAPHPERQKIGMGSNVYAPIGENRISAPQKE
jgi:hypothetical protein